MGVGDERAYMYLMSSLYALFIRSPLETRKLHIQIVLFPESKVRQTKLKCTKMLSASEVSRVVKHS